MTVQVVDYSFSRPASDVIAAAGYVGAIRYLSGGNSKDITPGERDALHAAGLQIGLVWETFANRAGQGAPAGADDAARANAQADELGWPADRPIFFAVDFQAVWGQVMPYFNSARSVSQRPVGVYGCYDVIEGAAGDGFGWLWQCAAWSGNGGGTGGSIQNRRLSVHAVLFQRVGYALSDTCDVNDVLHPDWGGWNPTTPTPTAPITHREATMIPFVNTDGREEVIGLSPDGSLVSSWELTPGGGLGNFATILPADAPKFSGIFPTNSKPADGRIAVRLAGPFGEPWGAWQSVPAGGPWVCFKLADIQSLGKK